MRDRVDALPALISEVADRWSLSVGGRFEPGGRTAWVAPAGDGLVLKLLWRHTEALHEADALRLWAGEGAVRLVAVEELDEAIALLLERCVPGTPLSAAASDEEQDVVVAGLLRRLWVEPPAGHRFRPLSVMCDAWADEFESRVGGGWLDRGLARAGIELFRSLPRDGLGSGVVLSTDLHAGNVLAAQREPWLAIDPKPYVGDRAYDVLQHMLNCRDRLRSDSRRLAVRMADLAGVDRDRVRLWLFARCVQESVDQPELAGVARLLA